MLGSAQGELWLGHRLELRIPVRMDPGLPLVAQCLDATVVDGDAEVPAHEMRLSVHGRGTDWFVDLRSTRPLRAAFVRLTLRMGCQFRMQRRYTLLVDPPPLPDVARHPPRAAHPGLAPHATRALTPRAHAAAPGSRLRLDWLARSIAPPQAAALGTVGAAAAVPAATSPTPTRPPGRLEPSQQPQQPQQPQQLREIETRLDSLHAQLRALQSREAALQARLHELHGRDLARQQELVELRDRQAHARRDPAPWRSAAWLLLAAMCALLATVLWRSRHGPLRAPWRIDLPAPFAPGTAEPLAIAAASLEPGTQPATPARADSSRQAPASARPADSAATTELVAVDRELFQRPLTPPEQLQIDEMVDHGHLADFFVGIGEPDKAIDVMRRALDEAAGGFSAMPYLVLFDLYRRTGRRPDYEQLERDCGSRLNLRIPHWDEGGKRASRDLLEYPRALRLLGESWGTPACLTVIERMIADDPRSPRAGFELAAYRDLLDLYALVREMQRPEPAAATVPGPGVPGSGSESGVDPELRLDLRLDLETAARADAASRPIVPRAGFPPVRSGWSGNLPKVPDDEVSTLPPLDFAWSTLPPPPSPSPPPAGR